MTNGDGGCAHAGGELAGMQVRTCSPGGATVALALATCRKVGELPVRARAWARRGGGGGRGLFCQHRECLPKVHVMAHGAHKQELKSSTRPRQRRCAVSGS
jgi:hypothetical protein